MNYRFYQHNRIKRRVSFQNARNLGNYWKSARFSFFYVSLDRLPEQSIPKKANKQIKFGITISKKWGKAHERNRFKRILREGFRHSIPFLPDNIAISCYPRRDFLALTPHEVIMEFHHFEKTLSNA